MSLPEYSIRYSKKAKYLQLRASLRGFEVVVPIKKKFAPHFIEKFLATKQAWIEKNRHYYAHLREQQIENLPTLPTTIDLQAIPQKWQVNYLPQQRSGLRLLANPSNELTLIGNVADEALCRQKLKQWLKQLAESFLYEELRKLSQQTGLLFNEVSIRNNITRWGSCSSSRNISLCCKLLFLPASLMRHVLLHELCHTRVMHHGKSFWKLLERFDSEALQKAKALKLAGTHVPLWIR